MASRPIVWIDNDLDYMLLVRHALRDRGVSNPFVCLTGEELGRSYLSLFEQSGDDQDLPCLVAIEVRWPTMAGLALLKWIRAREEFLAVPVLLLGNPSAIDSRIAKEFGADDFYPKLWNTDAIDSLVIHIVQNWLQGRTDLGPHTAS